MFLGAWHGRRALAIGVTSAIAVGTFILNAFAATVDGFAWAARLSPFFYPGQPSAATASTSVTLEFIALATLARSRRWPRSTDEREDLTWLDSRRGMSPSPRPARSSRRGVVIPRRSSSGCRTRKTSAVVNASSSAMMRMLHRNAQLMGDGGEREVGVAT